MWQALMRGGAWDSGPYVHVLIWKTLEIVKRSDMIVILLRYYAFTFWFQLTATWNCPSGDTQLKGRCEREEEEEIERGKQKAVCSWKNEKDRCWNTRTTNYAAWPIYSLSFDLGMHRWNNTQSRHNCYGTMAGEVLFFDKEGSPAMKWRSMRNPSIGFEPIALAIPQKNYASYEPAEKEAYNPVFV